VFCVFPFDNSILTVDDSTGDDDVDYESVDEGECHVLAALSCYRLSHRDSTFANWTAEQHLHDRCGLRDRTCVGPRRVSGLPGPVRGER